MRLFSCVNPPFALTVVPALPPRAAEAARPLWSTPILLDQHRRLATYDAFVDTATASVAEAGNSRRAIALLVADVDHYRRLSEEHGQQYAETVLRIILDLARTNLREGELVSYRGGDEFVALLRSSPAGAQRVAARLCAAVRGHAFPDTDRGPAPRVTISIGVAAAPEHGSTYQALHAAADSARVRVKAQGRDGAAPAAAPGQQATHRPLDIDRFAGRGEEFKTLVRCLDEAVEGNPRIAVVLGEIGTGTATLVQRLEPEVRLRGGSLVTGRCREQRVGDPYRAWTSLITALHRLPDAPSAAWSELHHLVPALGADLSGGGARWGSKYRLLDEMAEYVRLSARQRPLVLLLDEMQWADVGSWDALEHVTQQLEHERLLILLTFRTEPAYAEAAERRQILTHSAHYREITLPRLTREEVKRWVEGAMHGQVVGREQLAFVYRHTEGNPLFIAQVLRTLVEEGAIWNSGEHWQWTPVSELRFPIGLPALIARRLARLSSSTQAVLSIAAVIGSEFDVALVVGAGAGSEAAVQLALSEGLTAGILRPSYERGGQGFAFAHLEVVEALVQSIPQERLRHTHQRVAEAFERRGSARLSEIALHYDAAGASGRAYQNALRAAEHAERVYAYAAANGFLHVAARNTSTPGELAEVRVRLATLAEVTGRFDEAEELCELAIEWYIGKGDVHRALTLRRMREHARKELGQPARLTLEALVSLDAESKALGFGAERVEILMLLSQAYQRLGNLREAEQTAGEGVNVAESLEDQTLLARALNRLAVTVERSTPQSAEEIYRRALKIFEAAGDVRGQARCHNNLGNIAGARNAWQEARQSYESSIRLARAAGMPDVWGIAATNLGVTFDRSGDFERAREYHGQALALAAAVRNSEHQLVSLYNMAHIEWATHAWESAAELYEATASLAQRIGMDDVEIGATAAVGLSRAESGDLKAARESLQWVRGRMTRREDWFQGREFVEALTVRVLVSDGSADEAIDHLTTVLAVVEATELYTAAWLVAVCGRTLLPLDDTRVRPLIERYASQIEAYGYTDISKQLKDLLVA